MSGGSWNYMYSQRAGGEGAYPEAVRNMGLRLLGLGDARAAEVAMRCAAHLDEAQRLFTLIRDQMHDVEWIDSGDCGDDQYRPLPEDAKVEPDGANYGLKVMKAELQQASARYCEAYLRAHGRKP